MKKILALLLAATMIVSFAACGKKAEPEAQDGADESQTPADESGDEQFPEGDPAEYSREYWEAKYPGENICPFTIDENGTERSYYWVSGFEGWNGTMESWIAQPFNWNGWHKTDDGCIVNKDETLKITDNWANGEESMSSCCTVTTEAYSKDGNDGNDDTDNTEGEEPAAEGGEVKNNVPDKLSFKTADDLVCKENFIFSAKYVGTEEDMSEDNDGLFFDFCGEDALYYVYTGFNEDDGAINHIWGYTRLYHFYSDADSYQAGLAAAPSYALKEQNDDALYFTTMVKNVEAESYSELYDMFANKETDGGEFDNFAPFNG